jgi:hypothetical protein
MLSKINQSQRDKCCMSPCERSKLVKLTETGEWWLSGAGEERNVELMCNEQEVSVKQMSKFWTFVLCLQSNVSTIKKLLRGQISY